MRKRWLDGYLLLGVLLVALDQGTKALAQECLRGGDVPLIPGVFSLSYLENTGAAFGSFAGRTGVLAAATAALLALVLWRYGSIPREKGYGPLRVAFALVLAGGAGNLIDRVARGYVIDFFYFSPINFPKFNVADICVTVGVAGFVLLALFAYRGGIDFLWQKRPAAGRDNRQKEETKMTVMQAIEARRSVRKYEDRPVEQEKLDRVLEAGRLAPSARNEQEWRFVAVRSAQARAALTQACGQDFVGEAPVILAVCAGNPRTMRCGQPAHVIDASIALSFMMLEAEEQGLSCCWIGSFDAEAARAAMNVPPELEIVALTPLGYAAESPAPRPRKPLADLAVYDRF